MAVNEGDPRITRVGELLRRWSIDELPNLVNVLRGDMSLIGPRPTIQVQVAQYTERQRGRLAIRPGLTGWAQIHGRTSLPWSERIELDLWYVEHRKLKTDLVIVWQTIRMSSTATGSTRARPGAGRAHGMAAASCSPASASATTSSARSRSTRRSSPPTPTRSPRRSTPRTTASPCR